MQSEQIGKLAEALAATQAEMKAPIKSKTMKIPGRGDYKYADLADVIEARRMGAKHGLAITQGMEMREGYLALATMLMHTSGEWKAWECPIPANLKPQELGSFLTYMRRYSESCAWGIAADDDDDGAAAQNATPQVKKAAPPAPPNGAPTLTPDQVNAVHSKAKEAGMRSAKELAPVLVELVGTDKATAIPQSQYGYVMEHLEQIAEHREPVA